MKVFDEARILAHGMQETAKSDNAQEPHMLLPFALELVSVEVDNQKKKDILFAAIRQLHKNLGSELDVRIDFDTDSVLLDLDLMTPHEWPPAEDVIRSGAIEFLMGCRYW